MGHAPRCCNCNRWYGATDLRCCSHISTAVRLKPFDPSCPVESLTVGALGYAHAVAAICCAEAAVLQPNKLRPQSCATISCGLRRVHRQLVQSNCPDALLEGYLSATPARVQAARTHFSISNRKRQLPACGCLDSLLLACDVIFISDEYR